MHDMVHFGHMKKSIFIFLLAVALFPVVAHAQEALSPDIILNIVKKLYVLIFQIASAAVTLFILWSGFSLMKARGNDTEWGKAKTQLRQALIGGLVVLGVWTIYNTIASIASRPSGIFGGGAVQQQYGPGTGQDYPTQY